MANERIVEILKELVSKMKERDSIRKILREKDIKDTYQKEKEALEEEITRLKTATRPFLKRYKRPFDNLPDFVNKDNIIEICFIMLMSGIDDVDLLKNYEQIGYILLEIKGEFQEVAGKLNDLLEEDTFSYYTFEEVLKMVAL